MALITATYDTVTKQLVVEQDGALVLDVGEVHFYARPQWDDADPPKFSVELYTRTENKEAKTCTVTRVIAKEGGGLQAYSKSERFTNDEQLSKELKAIAKRSE